MLVYEAIGALAGVYGLVLWCCASQVSWCQASGMSKAPLVWCDVQVVPQVKRVLASEM